MPSTEDDPVRSEHGWREEDDLTRFGYDGKLLQENYGRRKDDPVRPSHYQGDYAMRVIEDFGLDKDFLKGTVVKYLLRAGNKPGDNELQDLKKALWYLQRKISNLEKAEKQPPKD